MITWSTKTCYHRKICSSRSISIHFAFYCRYYYKYYILQLDLYPINLIRSLDCCWTIFLYCKTFHLSELIEPHSHYIPILYLLYTKSTYNNHDTQDTLHIPFIRSHAPFHFIFILHLLFSIIIKNRWVVSIYLILLLYNDEICIYIFINIWTTQRRVQYNNIHRRYANKSGYVYGPILHMYT